MSPQLNIQLLGEFRLFVDGQPLTSLINRPRQQALLAYLLLNRHAPQSRQQIAFHFWPDSSESQSFTNLRKLFFQLRQLLAHPALPHPDKYLSADSGTLGWQPSAPYALDVATLEQALTRLEQHNKADATALKQVVTTYTGELLPTCYDDWLLTLRRALHERVVNGLTQALASLETQHEYPLAIHTAEYLLRLDPLHEPAYRHLMQLRALTGDHSGALRLYQTCVAKLQDELGVSPATATQALYQQLLKSGAPATPASTQHLRHHHIPLVGRVLEWQTLQQAWHAMPGRAPHFVTVWGEAGVGKTRLVEELQRWATLRPGTVTYARSYAAEGALSYAPITEWLRSDALHTALMDLEPLWLSELARLLPELLTERPDLPAPALMREDWQRQRFREAVARAVLRAPAPRLFILDDLQWCDGETLAWLRYLLRFDPHAQLLVVGTARSDATEPNHPLHPLRQQLQREGHWVELTLAPLSDHETSVLAGHLTNANLTTRRQAQLYRETEGNPLFVLEMVRAGLIDESDTPSEAARLPATVHTVISSRLARLSSAAYQIAQLAATIGRRFSLEVMQHASEPGEVTLVQALEELWHKRLVREQFDGYDFSHDKIREVIYHEISPMRQRNLHDRVAAALEQLYVDRLDEVSGELAAHYERAGKVKQSLSYMLRAAKIAHRLYAQDEAIRYLRHGLKLAETLPPSPATETTRLELLTYLSYILLETQGTASADVIQVYEEARRLNLSAIAEPNSFALLHGMMMYYRVRADCVTALELGEQLLALAQQSQRSEQLIAAHFQLGALHFTTGNLLKARDHLALSSSLCTVHQRYARPHSVLAEVLLLLGYPEQALAKARQGLEQVRAQGSSFDIIAALGDTLELRLLADMHDAIDDDIVDFNNLTRKHAFAQHATWGRFLSSWSRVEDGGLALVAQMETAVRDFQKTGGRTRLSRFLGIIAALYFELGQDGKADALWQEAVHHMEVASEEFWGAELFRLKGLMLLKAGNVSAAESEAWLLRALETARHQEAKLLELRAARSLSRLWLHQGQRQRAHELLTPLLAWFTEGFDTADLRAAAALLATLE